MSLGRVRARLSVSSGWIEGELQSSHTKNDGFCYGTVRTDDNLTIDVKDWEFLAAPAPVAPVVPTEGIKQDDGKDPWHLVPWDAARAIVRVLRFGAEKYGLRNWEKGMAWSRCYAAMMRHMTSWWEGEPVDLETGYSHLWHAGCCVCFLIAYEIRGTGTDDRPCMKS